MPCVKSLTKKNPTIKPEPPAAPEHRHGQGSITATSAVSSGVTIDPATLRDLMTLRDAPGIIHFAAWLIMLAACGYGLSLSVDTVWFIPAMIIYASVLVEPSYAISHESAHATYVKSKWMNTAIFWFTSLVYFENPVHRYHAHMRHHNFTWYNGMDAQISRNPLYIHTFLIEFLNLDHYLYNARQMLMSAVGVHSAFVRTFTPDQELGRIQRASLFFLAVYGTLAAGAWWFDAWTILLTYLVIPRLVGALIMQLFVINQHAEMDADQPDIRKSCRSFDTNRLARFLGCDMNRHVEHHLYPKVPFHALDKLKTALGGQLPAPDKGMFAADAAIFARVCRRTFGCHQPAPNSLS